MALGSTQPLTEMSTINIRIIDAVNLRPERTADNLTLNNEPIFYKSGNLNISQTYRPSRPITGKLFILISYNLIPR
jgi:hypothetical protein